MLSPVHRVPCSPALAACQRLMQRFALWLCEANVRNTDVTLDNLKTHMPSAIEGEWLWTLIAGKTGNKEKLLKHAQAVAHLQTNEKQGLAEWVHALANLPQLFTDPPPAALLPTVPPNRWSARSPSWTAFKTLMVAFYEDGLREGLPYQNNGTPTSNTTLRVNYEQFMSEFRQTHRLDQHPDARDVCALCGGELKLPAVDHWAAKSAYPLLAVSSDNLLPICGECNAPSNKGQNPVHTKGSFADWFHPYLRHANGALRLRYDETTFAIRVESNSAEHALKVRNLDALLKLAGRWTREFKAEYRRVQREVQQLRQNRPGLTLERLRDWLIEHRDRLSDAEPNVLIHRIVADAVLDPARLSAL